MDAFARDVTARRIGCERLENPGPDAGRVHRRAARVHIQRLAGERVAHAGAGDAAFAEQRLDARVVRDERTVCAAGRPRDLERRLASSVAHS